MAWCYSFSTSDFEEEPAVKKAKKKKPVDEPSVQYEEIEIDEANPDDDKYDPDVSRTN